MMTGRRRRRHSCVKSLHLCELRYVIERYRLARLAYEPSEDLLVYMTLHVL